MEKLAWGHLITSKTQSLFIYLFFTSQYYVKTTRLPAYISDFLVAPNNVKQSKETIKINANNKASFLSLGMISG